MNSKLKFVIIGSGNIAWQMSKKLKKEKQQILQIYSRKISAAKKLATLHKAEYTSSFKKINKTADVYLIAVSDDAIAEVVKKIAHLNNSKNIFIHTSGSIPSKIFEGQEHNFAVIWPPQSINKEIKIDFSKVPLCITAEKKSLAKAKKIARLLSKKYMSLMTNKKNTCTLLPFFQITLPII